MAEVLSLAFPGFLAVTVYRWFARSRSRAGWDYLILTGFAGGLCYTAARLVAISVAPIQELDFLRFAADFILPSRNDSGTYALSFPIALLLGWGASLLFYNSAFQRLYVWLGMRHPPGQLDALSQLLAEAKQLPMVVSTTLGQVYIGEIQQVTTDPDEDTKVLVLRTFAGGSRIELEEKSDDGISRRVRKVRYNYAIPYDTDPVSARLTYLDFRDVVSVSQFGLPEFDQTRQSGYSIISDQDFAVLLESLMSTFEGFAELAEQFYDDELHRLRADAGVVGQPMNTK